MQPSFVQASHFTIPATSIAIITESYVLNIPGYKQMVTARH